MNFGPIRPTKVVDAVFDRLRARIESGALAPRDRLPSERAIAEQMKVSRPVVREAINMLAGQGLIEVRPRRGMFVRVAAAPGLGDPLASLIGDSLERVLELLDVRRELETHAASLAAEFATPHDIADLAAIIEDLESDHAARRTGEDADVRFHCRIAQAAGNTVLTHIMATLHGALTTTSLIVASRLHASDHYRDTILDQHRAIFAAIRDHAPAEARARMGEHLDFVTREVRYHTRKSGERAAL